MGWARFDDNYSDHPKVRDLSLAAEALDMRAIIFSARYDTDGLITPSSLRQISHKITKAGARVDELVASGRWTTNVGGGWLVHDYLQYNPSKAERQRQREQGRERVRKHRSNAVSNASHSRGGEGDLLVEAEKQKSPPPWRGTGEKPLDFVQKLKEKSESA